LNHPSDPVLERLTRLHPKLIDLSLDRVKHLLGKLGAPHMSLPPVVHVAGTNAKGSVIAMMRAALEAAGYRVHVHTSPHLVRFNERIRLAGTLIEDDALIALLEECEVENGDDPITFFEITTCAAMLAFSRTPADIVLLETGLGGRLDATNAIREAALTVITPISMDHQNFLGDSLAAIAAEKAGILKPGVTCVMAEQPPEAAAVVIARAAEIGAPMVVENVDWTIRRSLEDLIVNSGGVRRHLAPPSLVGPHQAHNAGVAVAALDRLEGFTVSDAAIIEGFGKIEWPARLQRIRRGRLEAKLGHEFTLWLDGGHNVAAAEAIASWLSERDTMPLHLVLGMIDSKDPVEFLRPLKDHIDTLYTVPIPGEAASLSAEELAAHARQLGLAATPVANVATALSAIGKSETGPARVLIAGSLYLAGKVLAESGLGEVESPTEK
jgi:dihydrofolate synthase/folylpolyglutamate synthase